MSSYLTKYLPSVFSNDSDESLNNIYITVPIDNDKPVIILEDLINNMPFDEIYNLNENTRVTYNLLEHIVRDIFIQFQYFIHNGFVINNISLNNIILVQDRYVIFDSENIDVLKGNNEEQIKNMNKALLRFISNLLNLNYDTTGDFMDQLKEIENTEVFYFLKKVDREGVLIGCKYNFLICKLYLINCFIYRQFSCRWVRLISTPFWHPKMRNYLFFVFKIFIK